jgi:putative ABC transport system permease protein
VERVRPGWTVVGVVGNVAVRGLEHPSEPQMYFPFGQELRNLYSYWPKDLVIRTSGDPAALGPAVRRIIRETDPEQIVTDVRSLDDILVSQTAARRTQLGVLGIFAFVAFSLSGIGIYALLSYSVSTRNQEVGVRIALGAQRGSVLVMFLRQALILSAVGIGIAVPLAYVAARTMSSLLFGTEPTEPAIYFAAALLTLTMTLAGSLGPALRAARIEPVLTIRGDV